MNQNQTYLYRNEPMSSSILPKVRVSIKWRFFKKMTAKHQFHRLFVFRKINKTQTIVVQLNNFSYLCIMIREVITFGTYFDDFLETVSDKVIEKIDYIFMLLMIEERISSKFIKHIEDTKGLYEIRILVENNIYRVFCCFDEGRLVVLFNGFQKKTQKTPQKEINKALKIMEEYYDSKK